MYEFDLVGKLAGNYIVHVHYVHGEKRSCVYVLKGKISELDTKQKLFNWVARQIEAFKRNDSVGGIDDLIGSTFTEVDLGL